MKELETLFEGRGEVHGFTFRQIERTKKAYLYEVTHPDIQKPHYEVFLRKINRRFGTISYPSGEAFGIWAWTYWTLTKARVKLAELIWGETCPNLSCASGVLAFEIEK
jgi:hypothetical protein